jgi:ribosomal protein S18 acetylase RimI-like enzyme
MSLNGVNLREATLDDIPQLLRLEQKVIEAERPFNDIIKANGAYYYDLDHLITQENSLLIVGEAGSEIIATGYIQIRESKPSWNHDKHGYLGFMYVAEDFRGQGLNRIIIERLVEWGTAHGLRDFYLDVYAKNESALRAYEKFGFQNSLIEMKLNL